MRTPWSKDGCPPYVIGFSFQHAEDYSASTSEWPGVYWLAHFVWNKEVEGGVIKWSKDPKQFTKNIPFQYTEWTRARVEAYGFDVFDEAYRIAGRFFITPRYVALGTVFVTGTGIGYRPVVREIYEREFT